MVPAAWGEGWWLSAPTSPSCRHRPQTTASYAGWRSPLWRSSGSSCCSWGGCARGAGSPRPQSLCTSIQSYSVFLQQTKSRLQCSGDIQILLAVKNLLLISWTTNLYRKNPCTGNVSTSIAAALFCYNIQEALKGVLKGHNLLDGSVAFGQLLEQQQALRRGVGNGFIWFGME